ncbi:hypothetical protein C8R43DRAFT_24594 [Mycena crocata]|nr:hypothetical protein C8R43DRAFT_24594 [Mycena crocata]
MYFERALACTACIGYLRACTLCVVLHTRSRPSVRQPYILYSPARIRQYVRYTVLYHLLNVARTHTTGRFPSLYFTFASLSSNVYVFFTTQTK